MVPAAAAARATAHIHEVNNMLVLTVKLGEPIIIGDDIVIKIVDIHGKQIRLDIEAPAEVNVYRGEIYKRIMLEKKAILMTPKC